MESLIKVLGDQLGLMEHLTSSEILYKSDGVVKSSIKVLEDN